MSKKCDCGYRVDDADRVWVVLCPLHESAPRMLEALTLAQRCLLQNRHAEALEIIDAEIAGAKLNANRVSK